MMPYLTMLVSVFLILVSYYCEVPVEGNGGPENDFLYCFIVA